MCLIITGRKKHPTLVELQAAELQNPDGAGIAWTTTKGVEFRKGLTAEQVHELLTDLPPRTRWVVHFRFATIGEAQPGLCHPFPVSRDTSLDITGLADRLLFHNGTVSDWKDRLSNIVFDPKSSVAIPDGDWSDSRGIAWLLALNGSTRALSFIDGKFVAMNKNGITIYPRDKSGWTSTDGCWYSNTYWRTNIAEVLGEDVDDDADDTSTSMWWGGRTTLYDQAVEYLSGGEDGGVADTKTKRKAKRKAKRKPAAKRKTAKKKAAPKRKPRKGLKLEQGR